MSNVLERENCYKGKKQQILREPYKKPWGKKPRGFYVNTGYPVDVIIAIE